MVGNYCGRLLLILVTNVVIKLIMQLSKMFRGDLYWLLSHVKPNKQLDYKTLRLINSWFGLLGKGTRTLAINLLKRC